MNQNKTPYMCVNVPDVDKIMGTLRNLEIEFVFAGYVERTSVGNTECSSLCLHSVVLVSDCPCGRIGKWGTCSILKEDRSLLGV
jgi:hypothetical protein